MPCIKRKYNYGFVCLYPELRYGRPKLCGTTVDVIAGRSRRVIEFRGFEEFRFLHDISAIVIFNILGFNPEDEFRSDLWIETKHTDWLLGHKSDDGVKLVVEQNRPIILNQMPLTTEGMPPKKSNNVFPLLA